MGLALSYEKGAVYPTLLETTIGDSLNAAAERWPEAVALISRHQNLRFTWSELKTEADRFALGLLSLGLAPGDRVGIWAPNCTEWTIAQFATARAGFILVNINPAYRAIETEYTLLSVGIRALICAASFKTSDYIGMIENMIPSIIDEERNLPSELLPSLEFVICISETARPGWLTFAEVSSLGRGASQALLEEVASTLRSDDPINIQFTSGTTGLPKGATLSHRNVLNNAYFCGLGMGLRQGDRLCIPVPLYHCFGMVMGNLSCVVHGATMVYPAAGFEPVKVLETVEAEQCTALHGVPTMFIAELEHPDFDRFDLSSLRTGIMAGALCPIEVMSRVVSRMNMRDVGVAYGMTETSPVSMQTATTDPLDLRVSTIGRVQPHLEVKIIDSVTGEILPKGVPGELCTKGYSVMLGYWNDPDLTSRTIVDGWMHTGDLAVLNEDGYGTIVGRAKDLIIRGGENIYPREIEEYIYRHDKVEEVQVIGVPDLKFGEEVCACVRLRANVHATEAEIREFCRGKIAHYKVPKFVHFVSSFPMTVTGKVQKHLLRQHVIDELSAEANRQ